MLDEWYYGHDENKIGPFSQQQLKDLAASGEIHPLDTIWKGGVAKGAEAGRVKNLFAPPALADALDNVAVVETETLADPPADNAVADVLAAEQLVKAPEPAKRIKQGRAMALKGADIIGQDGTQAKYRMKCTECGHKDSSSHALSMVTNRTFKLGFYCRKCKRKRDVVVQVYAG